jgi:hypothetical protein
MSRAKYILLALVMAIAVMVFSSGYASRALARGYITVTPSSGSQYDTFEFDGTGFVPHECLHTYLISPGGDEFDWVSHADGSDCVYTDDYGNFTLLVRPVDDLKGSQFGVWEVHFETDRNTEVVLNFTVLP